MKPGRLYSMLASRQLTAGLLLCPVAAYLLFTLGEEPYPRWVRFVFFTPTGLFFYLGLIVNILLASIRTALDRIRVPGITADGIKAMDAWAELPSRDNGLQKTAAWMRKKGFSITVRGRTIHGARGRYSFLPGMAMRTGVLVLLVSLLISVHTRETLSRLVHPGDALTFFGPAVTASEIEADLPQDFLQVGDDSSFLIEKARVKISSSRRTYTITQEFPVRINGDYVRLVHLGYAQPFTVRWNGRHIEKRIDLDILPPGKTQIVDIPGENRFLIVSLEPDGTVSKGLLKGKQYNLNQPFYRIAIQGGRGERTPQAFTIRPGERRKAGSLDLSLGRSGFYAGLQIVRDPALAGVYLGCLLTLAGLLMMLSRFSWFRREMNVLSDESVVLVGYQEEFFKKWGIQKFYRWKNELVPAEQKKAAGI